MPLRYTMVLRLWKISSALFMRTVKRRERRAPSLPVVEALLDHSCQVGEQFVALADVG